MLKTYLREKRRKKIEREKNDDHVLQKRIIFFLEIKTQQIISKTSAAS